MIEWSSDLPGIAVKILPNTIIPSVSRILIHQSYMSLIDLDCRARFDIREFVDHPHFA